MDYPGVDYLHTDLYHQGVGLDVWIHGGWGFLCHLVGSCTAKPCGPLRANYFDAVEPDGPRVLYAPWGLIFGPQVAARSGAGTSSRTEALRWVLDYLGEMPSGVPTTQIEFTLPRTQKVSLRIYDIRGRLVRTLVDGSAQVGHHKEIWRGDDDEGRPVASGVHLYVLETPEETRSHKMALIR